MSKRRRIFDIDMPDEVTADSGTPQAAPETKSFTVGKGPSQVPSRGPMATAITENAQSLREREEIAEEIRAENDALAHDYVRARNAGLVIEMIPLDAVSTHKLIRDRSQKLDLDLSDLVSSIRDIGLSNPIRVEEGRDGKHELVQGFRRLAAYKELLETTGDAETWGRIPAAVLPRGEGLSRLYRQMVDENLIRKDISFAEMATLAMEYAADPQIEETDPNKAVAKLFESASYQKRSYIRSFIRVVQALRGTLEFPHEIPRSLGLALSNAIEVEPEVVRGIKLALEGWENRSVRDELEVLRRYAGGMPGEGELPDDTLPSPHLPKPKKTSGGTRAKTSFELRRPQGKAKCVAGSGRLEIRLDRDFSTIDRRRLEGAVQSLLDQLE